MQHRSFRTIILIICLLGLLILPSALSVRATRASTPSGKSFQPSGHGIAVPQKINTATLPHVVGSEQESMSLPPSSPSHQTPALARHQLPDPQNVVNVPPATTKDPSTIMALTGSGFKPDANGAGGVDNYLETVNTGLAIYSRSGTLQMRTTYQSWFKIYGSIYDPVTTWDDIGDRFIFSILQSNAKKIWLSVAQQTDATGTFCNYSFPTPSGHDFDKLGVDSDGIYFGFNILAPGNPNLVVSNQLFFVSRTLLESCQTATYTEWTGLTNPDGTIAEAITPARQDTDAGGVEYLVNSYPAGACQLTLWTLTNTGTLSNTSVPTQCYSPPTNAKQEGSSALINTGDCSITQASYVNGLLSLDMPGSYDWGDGNGPVSIVEWYVLNPSTASVASQGAFGTPGYWLFYPSTVTTANGHMLFVYNASGASIYPSIWYVNQTFTGATALAKGHSYYGTSGTSQWGDYQSAWPDTSAVSPNSVWITGEFGKSSTAWGTAFDLVTP